MHTMLKTGVSDEVWFLFQNYSIIKNKEVNLIFLLKFTSFCVIFLTFVAMKIVLLQMDLAWADACANRTAAENMIRSNPGADLYIMPEMFTTGYCTSPVGIAERNGSDTIEWLRQVAAECDCAIAGSVAVECDGEFFNRFYFATPEGTLYQYDKRHLFTFAGEHKEYRRGSERIIIDYRGVRILPLVCYDLRFPVFSRNGGGCGEQPYDLAIYVASWATPRVEVWSTLLRARAMENVCYVAGVNRVGSDPYSEYPGCSVVVDFLGNVVAQREMGSEGAICAELDLGKLTDFRVKFPSLNDADKFEIK